MNERIINQYRLTSELERSEDHAVYLAEDMLKQRMVLLHEIKLDPTEGPDALDKARQSLIREAKLTMELDHPNVLRVEHLIPREDECFVVCEWIEGARTLREALRSGPMNPQRAVAIALAALDALHHAHEHRIVHRNVRPEHLLLFEGGVKLTSFAMAKKADLATRSSFDLRQMIAENPYAAPEFRLGQSAHHKVDARADVFALAAVLYEMLTGQPPAHVDEKVFEAPSRVNPAVPPELDEAIARALRFDPAQRLPSASAFKARLLEAMGGAKANPTDTGARYTERRLIKRTRNSLIFQATDAHLGRPVALKKLILDAAMTPSERQQALSSRAKEESVASALVHPHIIVILDHFIEDEDAYLVMEWLDGADLRETLDGKRPPLSYEEILSVVHQVGEAIAYAHRQGVIHRDLKPENLMLHQGHVTVLDFGLAGPVDPGSMKAAGTARYLAPEIIKGEAASIQSDLFALAVVAYELLTGSYPYRPEALMAGFATGQLVEAPVPPSQMRLEVTPEVDAVLLKALAIHPSERYDAMTDFLDALNGALSSPEESGDEVPWKALLLTAVGALLLGGLVLGGFFMSPIVSTWLAPLPAPAPIVSPVGDEIAELESPEPVQPLVTPRPDPTPEPTLEPTEQPTPTTTKALTWASRPVTRESVTLEVTGIRVEGDRTRVKIRVTNHSAEAVSFLSRNDSPDLLKVTDDLGVDYSLTLDMLSVSAGLVRIEPGATADGSFMLKDRIDPEAALVTVELKEYAGAQREFVLRAHRIVDKP
ncbi:Serine/threonine-protein kinase PknB [compost metagenome]